MTIRMISLPTVAETMVFGKQIGSLCEPGDIICLSGELGAGKTTLTQAVAVGAGVADNEYVLSPSFGIMHEYCGKIPVYHMDFYRLSGSDDVLALGLDEYFYRRGITIIEWYEKAQELIVAEHLLIHLTVDEHGKRTARMSSPASSWNTRFELAAISEFGRI